MNLDRNNLQKLYAYMLTLVKKDDVTDEVLLEELLESSAEYALKAHERGELYSTEEVKNYIEKQLGWK